MRGSIPRPGFKQEINMDNCWFTDMCLKYFGKDYGSCKLNQYWFYRKYYKMPALRAFNESFRVRF